MLCRSRPWTRFLFPSILIVLGLGLRLGPAVAAEPAPLAKPTEGRKPNFLFLLSDDQRADTIAAHGNPHIRTPTLDRLAARGASFRANYCLGGNSGAVCVPSRAMILSGRSWFRVSNDLEGVVTLPEHLRHNGWMTFGTGKWHNGESSFRRSFECGKAVFFGGMSDHTKVPLRDLDASGGLSPVRTMGKYSSEIFADAAVEFLETYRGEKPFFAYVAFTAPHDPRMPPLAYRRPYYQSRPPLPSNFLPQHPFDNGQMKGGRDEDLAPWPRTREVISDQIAEYYGLITHLDGEIGRILDALRASGREGETFVIFAADQGLALGSHGLLGKQSLYEHSMRAPLIIAGPGIPPGTETRAFTYLLDLYPTICALSGIEPPPALDGLSLERTWKEPSAILRDSIFLAFLDVQRAVRSGRWKLIVYPRIGYLQLFDLEVDPGEMRNLVDEPGEAERVKELLALLRRKQAESGDGLAIPDDSSPPPPVDLSGRKRSPDPWQPDWIREKYFDVE